MNILYIGALCTGSTALHRAAALKRLGHHVITVDTTLPFGSYDNKWFGKRFAHAAFARLNPFLDFNLVNSRILGATRSAKFELLWIDKGMHIYPETLDAVKELRPNLLRLHYSPDDMFNPNNQTSNFRKCFGKYDLFVTNKTYNVQEYLTAGAKAAYYVGNGYDPLIHRPIEATPAFRKLWGSDLSFVGAHEDERAQSLRRLAGTGSHLGLYGGGKSWEILANRFPNVTTKADFLTDLTYAKVLCTSKISLGFLRKQNRDKQTTRSVEIPACGVFMLAERTDEHLELFEEGKEAEFFSSDDEMVDKALFYLRNHAPRKQIASNGFLRCVSAGYSNDSRLATVLRHVSQHR
jgi:spore maturation protein CgeB